jgi:hypothetical protein
MPKRLIQNRIPEAWQGFSFPSILPVQPYLDDLVMRVKFLDCWVKHEGLIGFNLGAFFHPKSF